MVDPFEFPGLQWQAVSPKLVHGRRLVLAALHLPVALGLFLAGVIFGISFFFWAVAVAVGLLLGLWLVARRQVLAISYAERAEDLVIRRGILRRKIVVMPYGRMQFIDLQAGPLARKLGYASVQCHSASPLTRANIPGLPVAEATRLRDQLGQRGRARLAGL